MVEPPIVAALLGLVALAVSRANLLRHPRPHGQAQDEILQARYAAVRGLEQAAAAGQLPDAFLRLAARSPHLSLGIEDRRHNLDAAEVLALSIPDGRFLEVVQAARTVPETCGRDCACLCGHLCAAHQDGGGRCLGLVQVRRDARAVLERPVTMPCGCALFTEVPGPVRAAFEALAMLAATHERRSS